MDFEYPSRLFDQDYNHEASSLSLIKSKNTNSSAWYCFGSSDDSGSVLSSLVDESELGFTETESEESEEDYLEELSRQMAHYMLQDDDHKEKARDLPRVSSAHSPLSTFWPPLGSNYQESPKVISKQALIDDQIQSIQYYKLNLKQDQPVNLKQDQPVKQHYQLKKRPNVIYPQSSGSKTKSCSGTGVFLPQGIDHASDSRKKQGCSTVLIPARVVQALKQHFDKVGVPSRFMGNFPSKTDGLMGLKNNSRLDSQQPAPMPANHPEIVLPQEWTY